MSRVPRRSAATSVAGRKANIWRKRITTVVVCGFAFFSVSFVAASVFWFRQLEVARQEIPRLPEIMARIATQPTEIVSADGVVLHTISAEYRRPASIEQIPQKVINATLAAEDKRFFEHDGIDELALMRILWVNLFTGRNPQGGSTITMQLAKRVYTSPERTIERKLRDMALATQIERSLTKEQILELYLNQVFFGSGAYGIVAAADVYFGKRLDQLTLAEAAMLARVVRRPSRENPFANLEQAIENRDVVLRIMLEERMITQEEHDQAVREPVKLAERRSPTAPGSRRAPYFVDWILAQVEERFPTIELSEGGYRVETTLDSRIQAVAEREVKRTVEANRRARRVTTAAFVLLDREGRVLAMVGGGDYDRNQFNVITQGRRQPGSTFKPLLYAICFELGVLRPDDRLSNEPFYYIMPDGSRRMVQNFDDRYGGSMSITSAMQWSVNTPAVRAIQMARPHNVVRMARQAFGVDTPMDPFLPLALGASEMNPLELAESYSVFQSGGDRVQAFGIRRVVGRDGVTLFEGRPVIRRGVIGSTAAEAVDEMLRVVVTSGTGRRANRVANARAKTGTTTALRDAWFAGYTDRFIAVGWVANEQLNRGSGPKWTYGSMIRVAGGTFVAPFWSNIVMFAQEKLGESPREHDRRHISGPGGEALEIPEEDLAPGEDPNAMDGVAEEGVGELPPLEPAPEPPPPAFVPPVQEPPLPEPGEEVVFVEICSDSGQLASIYCPERVRRPFRVGSEPRRPCPLHPPPGI